MSQTLPRPPSSPAIASQPEFVKFRALMEAAAGVFSPAAVLPMLNEYVRERAAKELTELTERPELLLEQLEQSGEVLLVQLIKANLDHLAGSAAVTRRFHVPRSTLHREKDAGRVITYRPTKDADFVFPVEQFSGGRIAGWAEAVIAATDNGAAALHFLYVPRAELGGESFAAALRAPRGRDVPALITHAAARLAAE